MVVRRVDIVNWALRTSLKFTTEVKYQLKHTKTARSAKDRICEDLKMFNQHQFKELERDCHLGDTEQSAFAQH